MAHLCRQAVSRRTVVRGAVGAAAVGLLLGSAGRWSDRAVAAVPSVYSFRYGNVGIISLDANDLSWEIQGLLGYSHGAQARWLEEQLRVLPRPDSLSHDQR
ncbi:MAG TPA: hypothetical protein VG123_40355 [Streptosporangiaceae bacterium]|nr:hypothetical protein [Streptosporangiaceae bacterium]